MEEGTKTAPKTLSLKGMDAGVIRLIAHAAAHVFRKAPPFEFGENRITISGARYSVETIKKGRLDDFEIVLIIEKDVYRPGGKRLEYKALAIDLQKYPFSPGAFTLSYESPDPLPESEVVNVLIEEPVLAAE